MTYQEARGSLQLMVEERIGAVLRAQRDAVGEQQDAASAGLRARVGA